MSVPCTPAVPVSEAGIVHLGLGNFHRAHQAVYTGRALDAEAGPWGIVGVATRSRGIVEALRAQDRRYAVLALEPGRREALLVAVHTELMVAADQPEDVVARLADSRTRIVTLTVTEHGYTFSPDDLLDASPGTTIGRLVRALQRRFREHGEPLAIVSCDNLESNGAHTRARALEFAASLPDPDAAALGDWIARSIAFPCTMVDRIVPATHAEHRAQAAELLGREDRAPVATEPFSMWVLEDRFPGGRPRWEAAGAVFSDDVRSYELLKLRLLNGTHSLIAYLSVLAGACTISEGVSRPEIRAAAEGVMRHEQLPTLRPPHGFDAERYMEQLLARFANSAIGHRATQVASDGSLKLPVRIIGAVLDHSAAGAVPRLLALTVAAYIRCLATPRCYDAVALGAIGDPYRRTLEDLGRRFSDSRSLVEAVLAAGIFAPAVGEARAFVDAVVELHGVLVRHGHRAAIEAALR